MGAKFYFLDNYEYKADDINTVFAQLTTGGVSLYKQKKSALIDYETAVSDYITPGVSVYNDSACKVVQNDDGVIIVTQGTCWLPDGHCIIIDEDGIEVQGRTAGTEQYVYVHRNIAANTIEVTASSLEISDAVMLAKINSDETITDMREFAMSKIGAANGNFYFHDTELRKYKLTESSYLQSYISVEVDVGYPYFNYAVLTYDKTDYYCKLIENQKVLLMSKSYGKGEARLDVYMKKNGGKITYISDTLTRVNEIENWCEDGKYLDVSFF